MSVDKYGFQEVRGRLLQALANMAKEPRLFTFRINERTLTQRLAFHLQLLYLPPLSVDCEYNRMWEEKDMTKELPWGPEQVWSDDCEGRTVYPDVIVHVRGEPFENLLVIEAKRDHPGDNLPQIDRMKLERFTNKGGDFHYRWGAFLNFVAQPAQKRACVTWFEHGGINNQHDQISLD
jgi:hypothetical protein